MGDTRVDPLPDDLAARAAPTEIDAESGSRLRGRPKRGWSRTVRMVCEVATFQALREQLCCKEVWVGGAGRSRN